MFTSVTGEWTTNKIWKIALVSHRHKISHRHYMYICSYMYTYTLENVLIEVVVYLKILLWTSDLILICPGFFFVLLFLICILEYLILCFYGLCVCVFIVYSVFFSPFGLLILWRVRKDVELSGWESGEDLRRIRGG